MKKQGKKKYEDKLIVKANQIIEASFRLTLQEQRIILYMAAQIKSNDEDFKPIRVSLSEFADIIGVKDPNYVYMQQVTRQLLEKVMTIKQENNIVLQIGWISSAKYFQNTGYVELQFDPNLKPYLLQLKERFTRYKLKHVIRLCHSYSIRFYELLKQYESIGWRYFDLKELMWILGIEEGEYKLYADFKRFILKPVKEEFDVKYNKGELDFTFEFEEVKESRKVVGIRFVILKPNQLALDFQEEQTDTSEIQIDSKKLVDELLAMKLTKRQANSKVKKYPAERILRNIELTKQKNAKGEVDNLPAFLIDAIDNDYAQDYKPANSKSAELRAKVKGCWNHCGGRCGSTWERHKDPSADCHLCAKFEKQRVTM
jgi:plasmid replication initiation protein